MTFVRLLVLLAIPCLSACGPVVDGFNSGAHAAEANDRIMLIRSNPPSFGAERLASQMGVYPDLRLFVSKRGVPDFLAEMNNRDRHYLILYYLRDRQAFACRVQRAETRDIQFAGPYPVTPREYKTLEGFRHQADKARALNQQHS